MDNVFLLSIDEANKYFDSDAERQCKRTAYCYEQGTLKNIDDNCKWWLRSSGTTATDASYVSFDGYVSQCDDHYVTIAVRPVVWINIES